MPRYELDLEKIKQMRIDKGLSQQAMADLLGYKTATGYSYFESGRCDLDPDKLPILADVFNLKMEELYAVDFTTNSAEEAANA